MGTSYSDMEYPSTKWTTDPALCRCSLSARGLFAHVMALVHGDPASASPVSAVQLAADSALTEREFRDLLAELAAEGLICPDGERLHVREDWL